MQNLFLGNGHYLSAGGGGGGWRNVGGHELKLGPVGAVKILIRPLLGGHNIKCQIVLEDRG